MRSRIQAVVLPSEPSEFRDDVRRMFAELERSGDDQTITGECTPALDVLETDDTLEVTMDLAGVPATSVRIAAKGHTLLIVGHKVPRRSRQDSSFHLVERGYGRFARAVRLSVSCDTSRATASLEDGELRISIPRLAERRGRAIPIVIASGSPTT
jgi:HSP20 family protein